MFRLCISLAVLLVVVSAIPVEQHKTAAAPGLVKQLFNIIDTNGDASISSQELSAWSFRLDKDNTVGLRVAEKLMGMIDSNGDQILDVNELCNMAGDVCDDEQEALDASVGKPQQVHLAPGASADSVVVSWVSLGKSSRSAKGTVTFGSKTRNTTVTVNAVSSTYDCGRPAWEGEAFHATLGGLTPDTQYWYRVDSDASGSEELSFTTPPTAAVLPMHFAVFGDMGTIIPLGWRVARQILRLHKQVNFDSMVHVGDIAYAGVSSEAHKEIPAVWDLFMRQMSPIATNIPYITTVGNHEKYCNYSSFRTRFTMPGDLQAGGNGNFWFSSDRGLVHWLSMSTEHDYSEGSVQYQFMEADLKAAHANRANTPWIVLTGHRPMYSSDASETDQHWPGAPLQSHIEPLMRKYGVDLYVGGHMHCYERTLPISSNGTVDTQSIHSNVYVNPNGTAHVVQGTAGVFQTEKWVTPQPEWSAKRMEYFGIGVITVHNATTMQYSFREMSDDKTVDEFWITKPAPTATN